MNRGARPLNDTMQDATRENVFYEQPLGERMRVLLRLEYLLSRARRHAGSPDSWDSRTALEAIIEVLAVTGRSDVKKELIKELERHAVTLEGLARNPKVDPVRLEEALSRVRPRLESLHANGSTLGQELRDDELLGAVRQRSSIPAGTCAFDLPALHFWLERPVEERTRDLAGWLASLDTLSGSVSLCLSLVRDSALVTRETAHGGFFQRELDRSKPCHMIRVCVPTREPTYPEISAGKHRFTVRFMRPIDTASRPAQTDEDVDFELHRCVF
jgi:cell division protein ZapD